MEQVEDAKAICGEEAEEVALVSGQADGREVESSAGIEDEADAEIEAMKKRVKEMEDEHAKIEALQNTVEKSMKPVASTGGPAVDARSVYVGNVDYATQPDDLQDFFKSCGTVNRVTIVKDTYTGQPKGYTLQRRTLHPMSRCYGSTPFSPQVVPM
jgi:hypothetical protein